MACSACQWLGVAIEMASRSLSSSAWRRSCTHFGSPAGAILHRLAARTEQPAVGIHQISDLDAVLHVAIAPDMGLPSAVDADHGHADAIVRPQDSARSLGTGDGHRGKAAGGGALQKITAIVAGHER